MGCLPEEIRLRYLYRRLILRGQAVVPLEAAKRLVGPDCAFHLYGSAREGEGIQPSDETKASPESALANPPRGEFTSDSGCSDL